MIYPFIHPFIHLKRERERQRVATNNEIPRALTGRTFVVAFHTRTEQNKTKVID